MSFPGQAVARVLGTKPGGGTSVSGQGRASSPPAPPPGVMASSRMSLTAPQRKSSAVQPVSSPASQANSLPSSLPPSQPQSAPMSPRPVSDTCNLPPPQPVAAAPEVSSGSRMQTLQRTLEPVQEDCGQASTVRNATVQELKDQLLAERSWWQKTSAAQVTQQVEQLRRDLETQQVTLAKIAEHLLANGLNSNQDSASQMQTVEASLNDCRALIHQQQQAQELQANALREALLEIHEQRAAFEKEITQTREKRQSGEGAFEKEPHLRIDSDLQEFANVIHQAEEQRVHLSKAIETERLTRIGEVAELRKVVEETSLQKIYIEKTIGAFLERAEQIEQKLGTSAANRDTHNLSSDIDSLSARVQAVEASTNKVDANGPHLQQVLALIRDAQEILRFEFAARLAEVEMKLREQVQSPTQPRPDADELAQRLEAIKSQLRAEIEKRIERSPNSAPLLSGNDSPAKTNPIKAHSLLAARTIAER